jgi:hypothetical protein
LKSFFSYCQKFGGNALIGINGIFALKNRYVRFKTHITKNLSNPLRLSASAGKKWAKIIS